MSKVLIAMSGGVDSSLAAHMILSEGHEAIGGTMTVTGGLFGNPDTPSNDAEMAGKICRRIGIEHHVFDLRESFKKYVVNDFIERYLEGKTPNPCIVCNKNIKFGALLDEAEKLGCDKIATGHYARVEQDESGRFLLKKAADEKKDQSYMLWMLSQNQLSKCIFPLGSITKNEVRDIAENLTFENAHQKDSQDVCFIPDGDYAAFISHYANNITAGNFVDMNGNVLGKHKGIIHYTVGQRKGLGLSLGQPMFVHSKNSETGEVVICKNEELFSKTLTASNANLISCDSIDAPIRVFAKARYHQIPAPATVTMIGPGIIRVDFDDPVRAISPGQSVVLYDGDVVVGGGLID